MTIPVFLESDTDRVLPLWAARLDPAPSTPVVSAAQFGAFISQWAANDPNGTWNPSGVAEGDGALVYTDEAGREVWPVVDIVDGAAVYAVYGWNWEV